MIKRVENKNKQINEILSVVKLSSLLFVGIIFCKNKFADNVIDANYHNEPYMLPAIMISILTLGGIYFIWAFSTDTKFESNREKMVKIIEPILFIILFTIVILYDGRHASENKFLFLFIITTTTIQLGMKYGMITASISSLIILIIDLVCAPDATVNVYFQNDLILSGIFILTAWPLGYYVKIEGEHIKELQELVNKDGLTGVYNHRYFQDALKKKVEEAVVSKEDVSLIFIDIDHFKYYNDLYGHQKGDEILKELGSILVENSREFDIVARYGGEEFAVILPRTSEEKAIEIAERIRKDIEETYFYGEENQPNGKITASIGISCYPEKANDEIELIKSADDALYRAKFFNKNRVETYTSILDEIKKNIKEEHVELVASIKTLISVINAKDRYTYGHTERVVSYSRLMAEHLGLSESDKKKLIYGAYMHDIGKINISKDILIKKMKLTDEEWNELKQHPEVGVEIIQPVESLNSIIPLIKYHHERYDGKGYPNRLKGEEIPYLARVLTVIDSFDAMTSNRPYNKRKGYEEGIEELRRCSGLQFDGAIVEEFAKVIENNKANLYER